jgi:hypothetical protein
LRIEINQIISDQIGQLPNSIKSSLFRACPRHVRVRSCAASCARLPRVTRTSVTPRRC